MHWYSVLFILSEIYMKKSKATAALRNLSKFNIPFMKVLFNGQESLYYLF